MDRKVKGYQIYWRIQKLILPWPLLCAISPLQSHNMKHRVAVHIASNCSQNSVYVHSYHLTYCFWEEFFFLIFKKVYKDQGGTELQTIMMLKIFFSYLNKHLSRDYDIKNIWIRSVENISISKFIKLNNRAQIIKIYQAQYMYITFRTKNRGRKIWMVLNCWKRSEVTLVNFEDIIEILRSEKMGWLQYTVNNE